MLPATPQRTAETRLPAPAPITPPLITCVVESGKPKWVEARITVAPAPWAENPCAASILMIRVPVVRMIRQPPQYVPRAIAVAEETITQSGGSALAPRVPLATRARVITPIVFCASLVPCARASMPPETICP